MIGESVTVTPENGSDPNTNYDPLQITSHTIARASHSHPLYKSDNASVFGAIESAARGSIYSTTIKPFARKKDGRGAYKHYFPNMLRLTSGEKYKRTIALGSFLRRGMKINSSWIHLSHNIEVDANTLQTNNINRIGFYSPSA